MVKKMKPLTAAEKKWISKLEAVLAECPSDRMSAATIGDPCIELYDKTFDAEICALAENHNKDHSWAVAELGCSLGVVKFPFNVHSTSG